MSTSNNLRWAFNSATIMNSTWDEECALLEEFGWRAVEVWHSKILRRLEAGGSLEQLRLQLRDAGIAPIGLCAGTINTIGENIGLDVQAERLAERLDVAEALEIPSLTVVVIGQVGDLVAEYGLVADRLHAAAEQANERKVLLNLEFLGGQSINGTLASGIDLVNRVNHPSLGLLFDFCHYYASASHYEELSMLPSEKLFMVHVDDARSVPMEILNSEMRTFPGEGRIAIPNLMQHLRRDTGYGGYWSFELYDKEIWKLPAQEVMQRTAKSIALTEQRLGELERSIL